VTRRRVRRRHAVALIFALGLLVFGAIWQNVLGVGDEVTGTLHNFARRVALLVDPPPDRPIAGTVLVTPRPAEAEVSEPPSPTGPAPTLAPGETATPAPTPTPKPQRVSVDVNLFKHPENHFISEEFDHTWCAVAGTQMVLEMHGKAPLTLAFQKDLASRIGEWESRRDSRNGGWGPSAMVAALKSFGVDGYEVRAYQSRGDALYDSARAISEFRRPVILLAWRGAHTWVMTGYRADADPLVFGNAKVSGAYINDPWYPLVSSIWGPSDPPGTFADARDMQENYLPWNRPEGNYPDRDGLFIAVVPTKAVDH
jgi:hypothetical protein